MVFLKRVVFIVCIVLLKGSLLIYANANANQLDIFSQENIKIEPAQIVQHLLLANANGVISGVVKEGIIAVDSSVTITAEAQIQGQIIVVGGELKVEPGASIENPPWTIAHSGLPFSNLVVGILFLLFIVPLVILPFLLWAILNVFRHKLWYCRLRRHFFRIQHRYPVIYIAGALTISGIMLTAFTDLVWHTIFRHTMGVFDNSFIWLIRYFNNTGLDQAMILITNLGYGYTYDLIVLSTFIVLAILNRWLEIRGLAVCLFGGAILNELLKHLFERARPDAFHVVEAAGYSFPSGHAMVSLCFYGMLAFLLIRNVPSWRWRIIVVSCTEIFILLIGISRVYLGVHYPSDVLAGYTAGAAWLAFSISLLMWWERKREHSHKIKASKS